MLSLSLPFEDLFNLKTFIIHRTSKHICKYDIYGEFVNISPHPWKLNFEQPFDSA